MLLNRKNFPAWFLLLAAPLCLATSVPSFAQDWHNGDRGGPGGPMEHSFRGGEHGRWWDNPNVAQQVGLTDDQKTKMDGIFQQHRPQLTNLHTALQKQEDSLRPLLQADQLDEAKVLSQIDTIAQARAELEKANARMLFEIRQVLTPDQWKKLQTVVHNHEGNHGWGPGGWRGPNGPGAPNGQPPAPPENQPNK